MTTIRNKFALCIFSGISLEFDTYTVDEVAGSVKVCVVQGITLGFPFEIVLRTISGGTAGL